MAISLAFGLQALRYPIGDFSRAGAGLFPLIVSRLLLLIGVITVVRSLFVEPAGARLQLQEHRHHPGEPVRVRGDLRLREHDRRDRLHGVLLLAGRQRTYSVVRNLKISAGLVAVALAFQKLLGFNLPLY